MEYALITGASKGIGAALAARFAKEGMALILVGRTEDLLTTLAETLRKQYKATVVTFPMDLLEPQAVDKLYQHCLDQHFVVRVLVNNAGYGAWGDFETIALDEQLNMIRLNNQVLAELCYSFLPMLKQVPYAHILNVASTAAYQPIPYFSVYAATKAFVVSFSRSLRVELKKHRINVSCLCPGPTVSDFWQRAGFVRYEKSGFFMKPEEVAGMAIEGMTARKAVIVPGFSNRLGTYFSRWLPAGWTSNIIARYFSPK